MAWKINFVSDRLEDEYFLYVDKLKAKIKAAIYRDLVRFEENTLPSKSIKHIEDGIFEIRTSSVNHEFRTLFFYAPSYTIIISHGFIKKTQKTPRFELKRALQNMVTFKTQKD